MISPVLTLLAAVWTRLRHPVAISGPLGSVVHGPARIRGTLHVGRGVLIFRGLDCVGPAHIGSGTFLNSYAYLRPGVVIGSSVAIGSHVRLITDSHDLGAGTRRAGESRFEAIRVGDGAWLGACVTVLPGVSIGPGAVVAAGSLVIRDVPPHAMVAGVPAVVKKMLLD